MVDPDDEVEAHLREDAEALLRSRRAAVHVCAWCGSVCIGRTWFRADSPVAASWRADERVSHTICPDCFDEILPGVQYP